MLLVCAFVLACGKKVEPPPLPEVSPELLLEAARARPVPDPLQSRLTVRVSSPVLDIAGSTGGGVVVDRPGRLRLDVFGPLGSTLLTVASDAAALDVLLWREGRHYHAREAEAALREVTAGGAGLDDLLLVLVGGIPFADAEPRSLLRLPGGDVRVTLEGPQGFVVDTVLDPATSAPRAVEARDAEGQLVLSAEYGEYHPLDEVEGAPLLPDEVVLYLPDVELTLTLRYRSWAVPDPVPDAFHPDVPPDFVSTPLEEALRDVMARQGARRSP